MQQEQTVQLIQQIYQFNMSKKYVVILTDELPSVNFNQVLENNASTLRYNIAGDKAILKFKNETPPFLEGKTQYDHSEIMELLMTPEWTDIIDNS